MADALATLARLRRLQEAAARRELARAFQDEAAAASALGEARQVRITEAGVVAGEPDQMLACAFAGWLPQSAAAIARRQAEAAQAGAAVQAARAQALACKGAVEAVEALQEERAVAARAGAQRRVQLRLDEVGRKARQGLLF